MTLTIEMTPRAEAWIRAEAQHLGTQPAEIVEKLVEEHVPAQTVSPNEKALRALDEIARRQIGQRPTDGSQTERIIREGRAGAMYGEHTSEYWDKGQYYF